MRGIVMKGPMPTICDMLTVVAGNRPKALTKPSSLPCAVVFSASDLPDVAISYLPPKNVPCANSSSVASPAQALVSAERNARVRLGHRDDHFQRRVAILRGSGDYRGSQMGREPHG